MIVNNFISVDQVKELGLIHENVDTKIIKICIRRAQDTSIQSILGTSLYREINRRIAGEGGENKDEGIEGIHKTLLEEYIWPALVVFTDYRVSKYQNRKIRNKTTGKQGDEYITPLSKAELTAMKDDLTSDSVPYVKTLIGYLWDNCDEFPFYRKDECVFEEFIPAAKTKTIRSRIYT